VLELSAGDARLTVDATDGGRWTSLVVGDLELLSGAALPDVSPSVTSGCFPMAPFAGRLAHGRLAWRGEVHELPRHAPPHAVHGTAVYAPWQVVDATGSTAVLAHRLRAPWPFAGVVRQHLTLDADGLVGRLEVHAEEEMPVVLGWHPYFPRTLGGQDAGVDVRPEQQYEKGDDDLPTGALVEPADGPHDDCFRGVGRAPVVRWPGVLELVLDSPTDHWVLFDEHPDVVCVEPQTGPPDAVRLGRATLVPAGSSIGLTLALRWRTLDGASR